MLSKHPDKCRYPHGHTRKVEFTLEAANLDRNEMVCDFKIVKEIIGDYLETLDHAMCVNTMDPAYAELRARYGDRVIPFENEDPTTEVMARVIFDSFLRKARRLRREAGYPLPSARRRSPGLRQGLGDRLVVGGICGAGDNRVKPIMKDVQSTPDTRGIPIDQVGITNLCYPISVMDQDGKLVPTVAHISMSVHLPHHFKGTHMSRFLEVLAKHQGEITTRSLPAILHDLKQRLKAESAHVEVSFPHFIEKAAPVSGAKAKVACNCTFIVSCNSRRTTWRCVWWSRSRRCARAARRSATTGHTINAVTSPSKSSPKMSKKGWAWIWIEELVEIAERSASAPVYALLKRPDERHVTMQAYDNPVFVEDLVRNVAVLLKKDPRITSFTVQAVNQESIHAHDAFARVIWKRSTRGRLESALRAKRRRGGRAAAYQDSHRRSPRQISIAITSGPKKTSQVRPRICSMVSIP